MVETELEKFSAYNMFQEVDCENITQNANIITLIWSMKKKANIDCRPRINVRGFEQEEGVHYDKTDLAAPVVNDTTI